MRHRIRERMTQLAVRLGVAAWLSMPGVAAAARSAQPGAGIRAAETWAFLEAPPPDPHAPKPATPPDPEGVRHVPGSARSYTNAQIDHGLLGVPDWFPQDHPPMPHVVAYGRKPAKACGYCHLPDGSGVPVTASLAGLSKAYILEQVEAFRSGQRGNGPPATTQDMAEEARQLDAADVRLAAAYFASLKPAPRIRVVETSTVPATHWDYYVLVPDKSGAREPMGERVIEVPDDFSGYEMSDERVRYVAYVPRGSIARGAVLAARGDGAVQACEACHGADLRGAGNIPPLAGRSPTYLVRELILFRMGRRTNPEAMQMREETAHLTLRDMIALAAYAGSRQP